MGSVKSNNRQGRDQVPNPGAHVKEQDPSTNALENVEISSHSENSTEEKSSKPFNSRYAHSLPGHPQNQRQSLEDHLKEVAQKAVQFAEYFESGRFTVAGCYLT